MPPMGRPFRPYTLCPDDAGYLIEDVWPPLIFGAERLAEIKRKVQRYAWAADMLETMRAEAEALVAREEPEQPIEPLGWRHEFFSKQTGDAFVFEVDRPGALLNPGTGRRETASEAEYRAWALLRHERTHRLMRSLGLLYRLTGDERYADWVADGLRRALAFFAHDEFRETGRHGALYFQPLYDAPALMQLAVAYDLTRHSKAYADEEHQPLIDGIFGRGMPYQLAFLDRIGVHNMGCWVAAAIAVVGNVVARTDWIEVGLDGDTGIARQLLQGVDADGLWYEGTQFYHFYSFCPLATLFELARALGDPVAEDPEVVERLVSLVRAPTRLVDHQDRLPAFGDLGNPRQLCLDAYRHCYEYAAGRLVPEEFGPVAARLAERCGRDGWSALAYGPGELPEPGRRLSRPTLLPQSGIGIFRSKSPRLYVCFRAGAHGSGHDHRDKLHLGIHASGCAVAPDLGTAGYSLEEPLQYWRGTLAHNTLMVDEADQEPVRQAWLTWDPPFAEGLVTDAYPGVALRRRIWFEPPFVLVEDECASDVEHRYTWIFGAGGDGPRESNLPPWPSALLAGASRSIVPGLVEARWRHAERVHLRALILSDGPAELTCADLPGNPLTDRRTTVLLRAVGVARRFRAVFEVHHGLPRIEAVEAPTFERFAWRVGGVWRRFEPEARREPVTP